MMSLIERLDRNSMPEPNSGCVLWLGHANPKGYGRLYWDGRLQMTHRLAWIAAHQKPIPDGLFVCHKCDVRACINPDHLWLGTNEENIADMVAKGRSSTARGERVPRAKLTDAAVRLILADPRPSRAIARDHGIARTNVSRIKRRELWAHVRPLSEEAP